MKEICLKDVANINIGISISRAKSKIYENGIDVKFINPKSIHANQIDDKELEVLNIPINVYQTRETKVDDILIKTTTPFDSVIIDKNHEGLMYNSFCIQISLQDDRLDAKYVFAFLNTEFIKSKLENRAKSYKTTPISKKDIEEIKIPYIEKERQKLIGQLYLKVLEKEQYYDALIQKEKQIIEASILEGGEQ